MAENSLAKSTNEDQVRELVQSSAQAVRNKDIEKILTHHSNDVVMFDVPKPFVSIGIDAYRKIWDTSFAFTKLGVFEIQEGSAGSSNKLDGLRQALTVMCHFTDCTTLIETE